MSELKNANFLQTGLNYPRHTVVPNNFRIAATARQITPNKPTESIGPLSGTVKAEDGISEHGVFPVHVRGD